MMTSKFIKNEITKLTADVAMNQKSLAEAVVSGRTEPDYTNPYIVLRPAAYYQEQIVALREKLARAEAQRVEAEAAEAPRRAVVAAFNALSPELQAKARATVTQVTTGKSSRERMMTLRGQAQAKGDSAMAAALSYVLMQTEHLVPVGVCYDCGQLKTNCVC